MSASRVVDSSTDILHQLSASGAVSRSLQARLAEQVSVKDFGAAADGATDDTAAVTAALTALSATGGTLYFPAGTYRINGQILLPNNGATPPAQASIRLLGDGPTMSATTTPALVAGTTLDMRYSGGGAAKIDTRGNGYLEIAHMTLKHGGTDAVPMVQTTNTSLHVHDCCFKGSKSGTNIDQDGIVLGGTTTTLDGSADAPFQGYGSVIRDNFFDQIRRCVYGRTYFNGISVVNNTIWARCGSNLAAGAAIEIEGAAGPPIQYSSGNYIAGNLIEVVNYPYGIKLTRATVNVLHANNFFDAGGVNLAYIRCDADSDYNLIIAGFGVDTTPTLSEVNATNTLITAHQSQESRFAQPVRFNNNLIVKNGFGPYVEDSSGNRWFGRFNGTTGLDVTYVPSGGANESVFQISRLSATSYQLTLLNATANNLRASGPLNVRSATGTLLNIGDPNDQHQIQSGHLAIRKHLNRQSGSDLSGTVTVAGGATTGAVTFQTAYTSAPVVTLTPQSDPGSRFWVVTTTTGFTVTMQTAPAGSVVFNWTAIGNPT